MLEEHGLDVDGVDVAGIFLADALEYPLGAGALVGVAELCEDVLAGAPEGAVTGGAAGALEATFDHGEEGYGLWLDPAVQDDPIYAEYWAGHRPVEVAIEEDQIIIRRAGSTDGEGDDEDDGD